MNQSGIRRSEGVSTAVRAYQDEAGLLALHWEPNDERLYDWAWLRDNCQCNECWDPRLGRLVDILDQPEDCAPKGWDISDGRQLQVVWGDGHCSAYELSWLLGHGELDSPARTEYRPVLWDAAHASRLPEFEWEAVLASESEHFEWLSHLERYGFALLRGVPTLVGHVRRVAAMIDSRSDGGYVPVYEQISMGSSAGSPITPSAWRKTLPGVVLRHWLQAPIITGETLIADSFSAVDQLRTEDPQGLELLSSIPRRFGRIGEECGSETEAPVIELGDGGAIRSVRFDHVTMRPLETQPHLVAPYYAAYRRLASLLRSEKAQLNLIPHSGDVLATLGNRVLAGQEAHDGMCGTDRVNTCRLDLDCLTSQVRRLRQSIDDGWDEF